MDNINERENEIDIDILEVINRNSRIIVKNGLNQEDITNKIINGLLEKGLIEIKWKKKRIKRN